MSRTSVLCDCSLSNSALPVVIDCLSLSQPIMLFKSIAIDLLAKIGSAQSVHMTFEAICESMGSRMSLTWLVVCVLVIICSCDGIVSATPGLD